MSDGGVVLTIGILGTQLAQLKTVGQNCIIAIFGN